MFSRKHAFRIDETLPHMLKGNFSSFSRLNSFIWSFNVSYRWTLFEHEKAVLVKTVEYDFLFIIQIQRRKVLRSYANLREKLTDLLSNLKASSLQFIYLYHSSWLSNLQWGRTMLERKPFFIILDFSQLHF